MKKSLLLLLLFTVSNIFCQNIFITQLSATELAGGVNVNVQTVSGIGSGYLSNEYTINGNIIDLSVCYWFDQTLPILEFNNDFFIPLSNAGSYEVNVHIILSTSQVTCDNYANTDNRSTTVSYLSTASFEDFKNNFSFFPNPTSGKIHFDKSELVINNLSIYDNTGRIVKK
ncbi:MAG: hypothetical protein HC854_14760 [Flavobacterium sp.]|nr:hypothetical protein [Flavobacterium sp.]